MIIKMKKLDLKAYKTFNFLSVEYFDIFHIQQKTINKKTRTMWSKYKQGNMMILLTMIQHAICLQFK